MDRLACDRMFIAVFETGSFVGGSERLHTSAGQASKLVSRLETELDARLFNRTTRAVSPTEVGQAYYDRLRPLMDEYDALDDSVTDANAKPRGRLRLTAPTTFGSLQLTPALAGFAQKYPDIALEVDFTDRLVSLVDEGYDAAIRVGRPSDSSLIARKLCTARMVAVTTPAYLRRAGTPLHPEDLRNHDCIIDRHARDPYRWIFSDGLTVPVRGNMSFSSAQACVEMAKTGRGVAYAPDFIAASALDDRTLVPILEDFAPPLMPVNVLYPPGRHLAAKVRVLIDYLATFFDPAPWE